MGMMKAEQAMKAIFSPEAVPEDFGTEGGGMLAVRPDNFYASSSDLIDARGRARADGPALFGIDVPVAILFAKSDNVLDPKLHGDKTVRSIPGATFELAEGGHMLPFTQPKVTAAFVRRAAVRLEEPHARLAVG